VVTWKLLYTKRAQEDFLKLKACGLGEKARPLLEPLSCNPFETPPPFEKLFGLKAFYSRHLNLKTSIGR
jgi:Txe/YoeB family toxin of Txe-Axe toxin-antitoxin module